ncbi:MAG: flagellar basal body rod protein FlgB [Proteobacteria bacterium]|nr:flagellar basal body rod protein FlgB [Pseudomonadota bacterium]
MDVVNLIERALTIRSYYHKVLAGNIANADTPNYKEKDIDFFEEIQKKAISQKDIEVKEKAGDEGINGMDGNTVNFENQMVKMTENSMMYNSLVQVITKKFSMMRYMINEGRR